MSWTLHGPFPNLFARRGWPVRLVGVGSRAVRLVRPLLQPQTVLSERGSDTVVVADAVTSELLRCLIELRRERSRVALLLLVPRSGRSRRLPLATRLADITFPVPVARVDRVVAAFQAALSAQGGSLLRRRGVGYVVFAEFLDPHVQVGEPELAFAHFQVPRKPTLSQREALLSPVQKALPPTVQVFPSFTVTDEQEEATVLLVYPRRTGATLPLEPLLHLEPARAILGYGLRLRVT